MPAGPGVYDVECTQIRTSTGARAVLLIVLGGQRGDGFSCQADLVTTVMLPDILERVAREIRASGPFAEGKKS